MRDPAVFRNQYALLDEAMKELDRIGLGNCAEAIADLMDMVELSRKNWILCVCGARRPPDLECPVCQHGGLYPCICIEFPPQK